MNHDAYRRIAPWYDLLLDPFIKALPPAGYAVFRVQAGMRVLEVGCGTGSQLAFYRGRGCRAEGVDLSNAMLQVARSRLDAATLVCRADALRLPYPQGVFDRVLIALVFHEMAPILRPQVLDEMVRVVRPDGYIGITDYHPEPGPSFKGFLAKLVIRGIERAAGRRHYRHYRHFVQYGGIPRLARQKGLRLERVKRVSGGNIGLYRVCCSA
jgi:ubiquinone/menaquinone biosynthesis C-methylase UbiE